MSNAENIPVEPIDIKPEVPVYADDIFEGARYHDFNHFQTVLKNFEKRTHTAYKNDGSDLLKSEDYPEIVAKYRYSYVNLKCKHYGPPRIRSKGVRHHKDYISIGCESRMKLHYRPYDNNMELTGVCLYHNHVCEPPELDANGKKKKTLPRIISYSPEIKQFIDEFKAKTKTGNKRKSSARPTPYSRPVRAPLASLSSTFPMVPAAQNPSFSSGESSTPKRIFPKVSAKNSSSSTGESSTPKRTFPMVSAVQNPSSSSGESSTPQPAQEGLQKLFEFMNPNNDAAKIQKLRAEMMECLEAIKNIPRDRVDVRKEVFKQLHPLIRLLPNSVTRQQMEAANALEAKQK